jgi:hypothetical protein
VTRFVCLVLAGLKALTDHLEARVESISIQSILVNWRLGYFFYLILKEKESQDSLSVVLVLFEY